MMPSVQRANTGPPHVGRGGGIVRAAAGGGLLSQAATDAMLAWWKLDETSGNRADAHGSYTLTDNNTVGYSASGVQGNAADFDQANNEYLSSPSGDFKFGSDADWWIAGWCKYSGIAAERPIFGKDSNSSDSKGINLRRLSGKFHCEIFNSSNGEEIGIDSVNPIPTSWALWVVRHDLSTKTVYLDIRGDNDESLSDTYAGTLNECSLDFRIGVGSLGPNVFWDGGMDEVVYGHAGWLSDDDITALYNSGSGITYEQATGN